MADDLELDFFGDADGEPEPQEQRSGRPFAAVLVVGPCVGLNEFEAKYSGTLPIMPITFVEIDDDSGEAHEITPDPVQVARCVADTARRAALIEAARKRDLARPEGHASVIKTVITLP